ncbi:MAG: hypothetical protein V1792_23200 [Pseudomonadota bacterium]
MGCVEKLKWPSFASFLLVWAAATLLTWQLVCIFAVVFMYRKLDAGMVPAPILLALALPPISVVTLMVEAGLFLAGHIKRPDSTETGKRLVLFGILPATWLCLWLITLMCGGMDAFIVRI